MSLHSDIYSVRTGTMRKAGSLNLTLYSHTNLLLEGMGKTHVICIWLVVFVNRVEDSTIPVEQLVRILMTFQRLSKGKEYSCH